MRHRKVKHMTDTSTFVCKVDLSTGESVEIRRLEGGGLVGFDGSFLEQMSDEDVLYSPYDEGVTVEVGSDESAEDTGVRVIINEG